MLILDAEEIDRMLSYEECIPAIETAMREIAVGAALNPLRQFYPIGTNGGKLAIMPGHLPASQLFGVKIVSKFPRKPEDPHGSHVGAVLVFDDEEGLPVALLEGGTLTAIRTAAASAFATRLLARPDSPVLTIMGTGEAARRHAVALRHARDFREILLWGRTLHHAESLRQDLADLPCRISVVQSAEQAVSQADVVCTVTSARDPILFGAWIKPGTHVNLVGAPSADAAEIDSLGVKNAVYFVDHRESAETQAGELLRAIEAKLVGLDHIAGEIGHVACGNVDGRRSDSEITIYKSLGISAQDMAAARVVVDKAMASPERYLDCSW